MFADNASLEERMVACDALLSPAQRRVAAYFAAHRELAMTSSAAKLAELTTTSNATVVRVTRTLGYTGMADFRRCLALETGTNLTPAARLGRTLDELGHDSNRILDSVLDIHQGALDSLRRDISASLFNDTVKRLLEARRVFIFGIGPSGSLAEYFALQLGRFGFQAQALTHTGLSLADGLHRLRPGDCLTILAYSRIYREVEAALGCAQSHGVKCILFTDTLRAALAARVDLILPVARGRATLFSMHTATLGLIEALLAGIAARQPESTMEALEQLNSLRVELVNDKSRLRLMPQVERQAK